jgi:hypothetical protein
MIYPNPSKDVETAHYPYADLFRDFSAALVRPNSVLLTYGYGFGDDHVNRIIQDMLLVPSTHLVIVSYDGAGGRVSRFVGRMGRPSQVSVLIGPHFGDLNLLVENYLPRPALDRITERRMALLDSRGTESVSEPSSVRIADDTEEE